MMRFLCAALLLCVSALAAVRPFHYVITSDSTVGTVRTIAYSIQDATGSVMTTGTQIFNSADSWVQIDIVLSEYMRRSLASSMTGSYSAWQGGGADPAPHTHAAADITSGVLGCTLQPALTGDVTTSGCAAVLANSGVSAGTYTKGTFDAKGRLTSGGNLVIGDLPSHRTGILVASCSGTATSSSSLFLFPFGNISALTCTITASTSGMPMATAGTLKNLRFQSGTAGKAGDAIAILKNGSTTGMPTCPFGAATTCSDLATAGAFVANDLITMRVTTTTSDTLANVQASVEVWQ